MHGVSAGREKQPTQRTPQAVRLDDRARVDILLRQLRQHVRRCELRHRDEVVDGGGALRRGAALHCERGRAEEGAVLELPFRLGVLGVLPQKLLNVRRHDRRGLLRAQVAVNVAGGVFVKTACLAMPRVRSLRGTALVCFKRGRQARALSEHHAGSPV